MDAYNHVKGIDIKRKTILAQHKEKAELGAKQYGFDEVAEDFDNLIDDDEIDVIDICAPPYVHAEMIERALQAGKYVICEKPLTGYFGNPGDETPIGIKVRKSDMYQKVIENMEALKAIVNQYPDKFMYAENYIYAPAIQKMGEIISKKKCKVLCLKGEESLKGSTSRVAGEWCKTGGGTFIRTGTHPMSAILWLKRMEAQATDSEILIESVTADMGRIIEKLSEYEHRHIAANPVDVEDFGSCTITFSDGTKGIVLATDTLLGGSRNYVEAYCNDAVLYANLTLSDMMSTYFLDEERLDDVFISEMLPSKLGWNNPFVVDEVIRGYVAEIQDFMECIVFGRKPLADFQLAYDTVKVTYAAYMSAEEGKRIILK
jgi:predicted dehydrogenase